MKSRWTQKSISELLVKPFGRLSPPETQGLMKKHPVGLRTCATRICPTHGSTTWMRVGSVPTPHDSITQVQKGLGNRAWTGFGQCQTCGSFLDPHLERGERLAAPPKPHEDTSLVFTLSWVNYNLQTQALRLKPERAHSNAIQASWSLHYRRCPRTQCGPGCVCGPSQFSSGSRTRRAGCV